MANTTLKFGNGEWYGKKDTILAYNDLNSNYKPLPFNFSRASKATVVNKDGLIEEVGIGQPRIDYKDDSKGALKLEPSRSNALPYSNKFLNTGWQYYRGTITANATISPDGTLNASRYEEDSQTGGHLFRRQSLSITNGLSYTGSIFVKKGEYNVVRLASNSTSRWNAGAEFSLENGTVTSGTGVIENYGNGWYRCSISGNALETTTDAGFEIYTSVGVGRNGDGLFMYGAMFEQGSYATSYIPTSGSIKTRVEEDIALTLPDNASFNSSVGFTLCGEFSTNGGSGSSSMALQVNGNLGYFGFGSNGSTWRARINNGTVNSAHISNIPILSTVKLALSFNSSGFSMYANGTSFASGNTNIGAITSADSILYRDTDEFGSFRIKDLKLYNTRLSDSELATLTTI